MPLLAGLGPWGVSVHASWLAAVGFGGWALVAEGPTAFTRLDAGDLAAAAYLAVVVTALAFVCWYSCVRALGAGPAGLLTGLAPVAAALTGVALGGGLPSTGVWAGAAVVGIGLAIGSTRRRRTAAAAPAAVGAAA